MSRKRDLSPISKRGVPRVSDSSDEDVKSDVPKKKKSCSPSASKRVLVSSDEDVEQKALLLCSRCKIYTSDRAFNLRVHEDQCGGLLLRRCCVKCKFRATQLHYLKNHMKKHHADKWSSYRVVMHDSGEFISFMSLVCYVFVICLFPFISRFGSGCA